MLQLIYELRKNWRGRVDGTGREKSKVLQEVLADLKIFKFDFSGMTNHSNVASNVLIFKKGLEFSTKTLGIVKIHTYKFFLIYFGS